MFVELWLLCYFVMVDVLVSLCIFVGLLALFVIGRIAVGLVTMVVCV